MTGPTATQPVCRLIDLPKIMDPRGNLTFVEGDNHIPFQIRRIFWIYDVPGGEHRGSHAYHRNQEIIIAVSGAFEVEIDDGSSRTLYNLNRSYYGLYVPPLHWRSIRNFSTNSLCMILASERYDPEDYIRDYAAFYQERGTV